MQKNTNAIYLILLSTLIALPTQLMADSFSYDYVQISTFQSDVDVNGANFNSSGASMEFSHEITKRLIFQFGSGFSQGDFDIDVTDTAIGLGTYIPIVNNVDLLMDYSRSRVNGSQPQLGNIRGYGNSFSFGVRSRVTKHIELALSISETKLFNESSKSQSVEILFGQPNSHLVSIGYGEGEDSSSIGLSLIINMNAKGFAF